jgi:hypothetical protein
MSRIVSEKPFQAPNWKEASPEEIITAIRGETLAPFREAKGFSQLLLKGHLGGLNEEQLHAVESIFQHIVGIEEIIGSAYENIRERTSSSSDSAVQRHD